MRRALPLLLVLLVAGLGLARSLRVGYLSDDWVIIDHVSRVGNSASWAGPWMDARTMLFHRPFFTALYDVEYQLFGADPLPAHVHHGLWHLAAVALVYWLARLLGGSAAAAVLGGLLFAVHPQLGTATGWLAARCGTVAGTLTLLTAAAWLEGRHGRPRVFAGLALLSAAAASLTRESGYLALVTPLLIDLVHGGSRPPLRKLVRRHLPFALCGTALLALRLQALGTLFGGYPESAGLSAGWAAWPAAFRSLGETALALLGIVPAGFVPDGVADSAPDALASWVGARSAWPVVVAAATSVLIAATLVFRWRVGAAERGTAPARTMRTLLALMLLQVALLLATGPAFGPATGQRWHAFLALYAILVGLAAMPLLQRRTLWIPAVLVLLHSTGFVLVQDALLGADTLARRYLGLVHEEIRELPEDVQTVFLSGLPNDHLGVPLFHWGVTRALGPPFRDRLAGRRLYPIHRGNGLRRDGYAAWQEHAPVEALLHARGERFCILTLAEHVAPDAEPFPLSALRSESLEAIFGPPEETVAGLQRWFAAPPLPARKAGRARIGVHRGDPLSIPIEVETAGIDEIGIHCFLPFTDDSLRIPVAAGQQVVVIDLGRELRDWIRFPGAPGRLHVVVTGRVTGADPVRLRLGPLLTFDYPTEGP